MKRVLRTMRSGVMAILLCATAAAAAAQSSPPSFEVGKTYSIVMTDDDFTIEVLEVTDGPWIRVRINEEDLVVWLNTNVISLFIGEVVPLSAQPTEGRHLEVGATVSGRLGAFAATFDGKPVQAWTLEAEAGTRVEIVMRSDEFDTYLFLDGPGLGEPQGNDDGADGTNSRLEATLPVTGTYTVVAGAYRQGLGGEYTLSVTEAVPLSAQPTEGRSLEIGGTVSGRLDAFAATFDGKPIQAWTLEAEAGTAVEIVMRSDEFDTYLFLDGPGLGEPRRNDDGADGTNSRIEATLPVAGTYTVVASAYRTGMSGEYTLAVVPVANRARSAAMRSDLRSLIMAQESYFADYNTYFGGDPCAWQDFFACSAGVSITIGVASGRGWNARATLAALPGVTCAVFVGDAPMIAPARVEGVVTCR